MKGYAWKPGKRSDHFHRSLFTERAFVDIDSCQLQHQFTGRFFGGFRQLRRQTEELPTSTQGFLFGPVCDEAKMSNAHETLGQNVQKEAADKLICFKRRLFKGVVVLAISILKCNVAMFCSEWGCDDWKWQPDGCSGPDSQVPVRGLRKAFWNISPSLFSRAAV